MKLEKEISFKDKISHLLIIKTISEIAEIENKKVYAVGGFVRDIILDRQRNDLDILVVGNGTDFAKSVAEKYNIKNVSYFKSLERHILNLKI